MEATVDLTAATNSNPPPPPQTQGVHYSPAVPLSLGRKERMTRAAAAVRARVCLATGVVDLI